MARYEMSGLFIKYGIVPNSFEYHTTQGPDRYDEATQIGKYIEEKLRENTDLSEVLFFTPKKNHVGSIIPIDSEFSLKFEAMQHPLVSVFDSDDNPPAPFIAEWLLNNGTILPIGFE